MTWEKRRHVSILEESLGEDKDWVLRLFLMDSCLTRLNLKKTNAGFALPTYHSNNIEPDGFNSRPERPRS